MLSQRFGGEVTGESWPSCKNGQASLPKTWERNGSNKRRTPSKTMLHDIGKGQTIQPLNVSAFTFGAEGQR